MTTKNEPRTRTLRMKVWLDNDRPMPTGYDVHARTAAEAIALLTQGDTRLISLDYNLGGGANGTGYEVARWIREHARQWSQQEAGGLAPLEWRIHSRNPIGILRIWFALRKADRFWKARQE